MNIIYESSNNQIRVNPFDEKLFEFVENLSKSLVRDARAKEFPNLLALAFWCRNLKKDDFDNIFFQGNLTMESRIDNYIVQPIGKVLHICPSNVPVMAFFSWIYSFLAGNYNMVKIPSRDFEELKILYQHFRKLGIPNTKVFQCSHEELEEFSREADCRMIWGGDATIEAVRMFPSKPTCKDLCFSDKVSYSVMKANLYIRAGEEERRNYCERFVTDVYSFGQMACSSPRKIFWIGPASEKELWEAKKHFYETVSQIATERHLIDMSAKVTKDIFVYEDAMKEKKDYLCKTYGSALTVICDDEASMESHCGMGLVYEKFCPSLKDMVKEIDTKKVQTISFIGLVPNEIERLINQEDLGTLSRFVVMGSAVSFGRYWDGFDIPREVVRFISI